MRILHLLIPAPSDPTTVRGWQMQMQQRQATSKLQSYGLDPSRFVAEYSNDFGGVWRVRVLLPVKGEAEVLTQLEEYAEHVKQAQEEQKGSYSVHYKDLSESEGGYGDAWGDGWEVETEGGTDEHPERL